MAIKVLVVDDSGFFRRRLKDIINSSPKFQVVATADNGKDAIEKAKDFKPDVITMDYEMPVMDGVTAVRHIMATMPTPILMFSSMTFEGATVTLKSLEAGAVDFMPKNFAEVSNSSEGLKKRLFECLLTVAEADVKGSKISNVPQQKKRVPSPPTSPPPSKKQPVKVNKRVVKRQKPYNLVTIGTSTGGPVALASILQMLPGEFKLPILLIQHMPSTFTQAFAERLNSICKIEVKEAVDGDRLIPGLALLAPGGCQMMVDKAGLVRIKNTDDRLQYKPCVDVTFGSAANVFQDKVLAIVLTGMGADGRDGARLLKQNGSTVWAQDKATSTIYGMPMAIAQAGLADEILALDDIGNKLRTIL